MRWARGLLFAVLVAGDSLAGAAPAELTDPAQVAQFIAVPGARTGCMRMDLVDAAGALCFDVQVTSGDDPGRDYFIWRFTADATATGGRRLERLKVRLSGRKALDRWAPVAETPVDGAPVTLEVPGAGAPVTFRPPAGRLVVYADDDLYHSSWEATSGSEERCCPSAEIGGVTVWSVPRGTGMPGRFRIEVSVR